MWITLTMPYGEGRLALPRPATSYPMMADLPVWGNCPHATEEGVVARWQGDSRGRAAIPALRARSEVPKRSEKQPNFGHALSFSARDRRRLGRREEALLEGQGACEFGLSPGPPSMAKHSPLTSRKSTPGRKRKRPCRRTDTALERFPNLLSTASSSCIPMGSAAGESGFETIVGRVSPKAGSAISFRLIPRPPQKTGKQRLTTSRNLEEQQRPPQYNNEVQKYLKPRSLSINVSFNAAVAKRREAEPGGDE